MNNYVLECCVDSVESAIAAEQGGATRLELCAALQLGGTTPGINLFRSVQRHCSLPINVLLRPRFGDFCYTAYELETIVADAAMFAETGANAVVIGMLTPDGKLDVTAMDTAIKAANGVSITLHRAFDVCADPFDCLETAIELGVSTILTSGQAVDAPSGAGTIAELHQRAAGRIEILAGAGVNSRVIKTLAQATHTHAYHMSGKQVIDSPMVYRKAGVPMGLAMMSEFELWRTSADEVAAVRKVLEAL